MARFPRVRRTSVRWACLATLLLLTACSAPPEVAGQVELVVSVSPVTANLRLTDDGGSPHFTTASPTVDGDSRVHVFNVTPGRFDLVATAPGYRRFSRNLSVRGLENMGVGIVLVPEDEDAEPKLIVVEAGENQTVGLGEPAHLEGSLNTQGLIEAPNVSWGVLSGPGEVTFEPPDAARTVATFSEPGTYALELGVTVGRLRASDGVTVTVAGGGARPCRRSSRRSSGSR